MPDVEVDGKRWEYDESHLDDCEIIQWFHRFVMAPGSRHPVTGATYTVITEPLGDAAELPHADEIPYLPIDWQLALRKEASPVMKHAPVEWDNPLRWCDKLSPTVEAGYKRLWVDVHKGGRHKAMTGAVAALWRYDQAGEAGTGHAIAALRAEFIQAVTDDGSRPTTAKAEREFDEADHSGCLLVATTPKTKLTDAEVAETLGTDTWPQTVASCRSGVAEGDAPASPVHLPDAFWEERPILQQVRQQARARLSSPDLVLAGCIARLIALTEPNIVLPPTVGSYASINYATGFVGPSSGGKSTGYQLSGEIVNTSALGYRNGLGIGSGEGLTDVYLEPHPEDKSGPHQLARDPRALFFVDEGEALTQVGRRSGATIMPNLRSALTGGPLGNANAKAGGRVRSVPQMVYRFSAVVCYQPQKAADILADADGGTPQRFVWAHSGDPTAPEALPDDPRLRIAAPTPLGLRQVVVDNRNMRVLPIAQSIINEVTAARQVALHAPLDDDDEAGHDVLLRLKVGVALAAIDGRLGISADDWRLAGVVLDTSNNVRGYLQSRIRRRQQEANEATTSRAVRAELAKADALDQRAADQLERDIERLRTIIGGRSEPTARRALIQGLSHLGDRAARRDAAIDEGVERGVFVIGDDGRVGLA